MRRVWHRVGLLTAAASHRIVPPPITLRIPAVTRPPTPAELKRLNVFYETMKSEYAIDQAAATALLKEAKAENGDAALVSVANVLLNLDETMVNP